MRVLQVIHGYPMRYNAGSEVYTQTLCRALAERHEVHVFTREEDAFAPDARMRTETDPGDPRITLHVVNNPRNRDRYRDSRIDRRFTEVLDAVRPDVVHVGHLNHLSTSLLIPAAEREIPILFTLHDYWLMCPRGQFIQMYPDDDDPVWAPCPGQDDRRCATRCYARYFSGDPAMEQHDTDYWTSWVRRRMQHVRAMAELVDLFLAPSRYLLERFVRDFALPRTKLQLLPYGFDLERLRGRDRAPDEPFTFGYIGTHIPAKGVHHLIDAFHRLRGEPRLRIWGRPRGRHTDSLQAMSRALPPDTFRRIEWLPEYRNQDIVHDVFDRVDAIVVPSIWVENAPLVIHEALQARVPVITADAGGMAELVRHEVNGLLFRHRSPSHLAEQMQRLVDDPDYALTLGARGDLRTPSGDVPPIDAHVHQVEALYEKMLRRRNHAHVEMRPGPWRITFDTNPDTCNLHCIMCEEHSPHSTSQARRRAEGRTPRMMPFELIRRTVAEAAETGLKEIIPSTMGEPLLYPEFPEIIDLCRRYGVKLNLTTNGTFPRLGAEKWARLIVPVASDVKISWNGATPETQQSIMLGSSWERALAGVRTFLSVRDAHAAAGGNRCQVTFQLTFLRSNVEELPDIVRLAARLGVDRVKGHHLWVHSAEMRDQSMRHSAEAIRHWNRVVAATRRAAREHPLPDGRRVRLDNIFPLDDTAIDDLVPGGPCPFLGQEAWVNAEGRFDVCCAPDELRRSLGDFGNLHETSLGDVWRSQAYRALAATYRNRHLCISCNMRRPVGDTG